MFEAPTVQSACVVNEFFDVFPEELPRVLPKREMEFRINLLLDTQPISITPFHMDPSELKELNEQLKDLIDKVFIRLVFLYGVLLSYSCIRKMVIYKYALTVIVE